MTLDEIIWRIVGVLGVVTALLFIVTNTLLRKKVFDKKHVRTLKSASTKIGKDAWSTGKKVFKKSDSKKPQLPGGVGYKTNLAPVVTPNKQPAKEVIIPLPAYNADPTYGFGNVEIKYFDGCNGYTLFETGPNGESLAFECVAGYDEKKDKYTIWFYKVKYHKDARKQKQHNDYSYYSSA